MKTSTKNNTQKLVPHRLERMQNDLNGGRLA